MRPGGDEGLSRLERPHSLRLPGMEQGSLEACTPQREDFPSPAGSQNSPNAVLEIVLIILMLCDLGNVKLLLYIV